MSLNQGLGGESASHTFRAKCGGRLLTAFRTNASDGDAKPKFQEALRFVSLVPT